MKSKTKSLSESKIIALIRKEVSNRLFHARLRKEKEDEERKDILFQIISYFFIFCFGYIIAYGIYN